MNPSRIISTATTFIILAASLAPVAVAGGEPKNESPFTRPAGATRTLSATAPHTSMLTAIQGEPKNQQPFTKLAGQPARGSARTGFAVDAAMRATAGQAKEQAAIASVSTPTNRVSSPAVVVRTSNGFHWGDLAIGSAAALAALLATSGALVLLRNLRVHKPGAAQ